MVNPVPGHTVSTPYKRAGTYWRACGWHTGVDFAAPSGTPIVAPISGDIRHRNYGSAFGPNQFVISPDPGEPFGDGEVFFAHTLDRLPHGTRVEAGQRIARVGAMGNVTGPHLHMELHSVKGQWSCAVMRDPQPVIDWQPAPTWRFGEGHKVYLSKLRVDGHESNQDGVSDSIVALQEMLNRVPLQGGQQLPLVGKYGPETDEEVRLHQAQYVPPADPPGKSNVGPVQAGLLVEQSGAPYVVVDDRPKDDGAEQPPPVTVPGVRFVTFNMPSRYKDGGLAADQTLIRELMGRADVIGLQEAGWAEGWLRGLGWVVHRPQDSTGEATSNILMWNPDVFTAEDAGSTLLSPATRIQVEAAGPTVHREKRIVWADLRHKLTGQVWFVGCVHMVPSKHLGGAALQLWKEQATNLVGWMGRQGDPCVVLGDFNAKKADPDVVVFRDVATIRTAVSHGTRNIDWVMVKTGDGVTSTPGQALDNAGQSDHKPVTATVTAANAATPPPAVGGLRGIDISSHQAGINLAAVDCDFVVVKATEGKGYVSPVWREQYAAARKAGRLVGLYHWAHPDLAGADRPEQEADYFVDEIGPGVVGEAVLVLDWEEHPLDAVGWAKRWLDRVYARTGVRAVVYSYTSALAGVDWSPVNTQHPLWIAKYGSNQPGQGWAEPNHAAPVVEWPGGWTIWQYTSKGRLPGYGSDLDLNVAPGVDAAGWAALAAPAPSNPDEGDVVTRTEYDQLVARVTGVEVAVAELEKQIGQVAEAEKSTAQSAAVEIARLTRELVGLEKHTHEVGTPRH